MSESEMASIVHLRSMLNEVSWTVDPMQFMTKYNRVRKILDLHHKKYGGIPKDLSERVSFLSS